MPNPPTACELHASQNRLHRELWYMKTCARNCPAPIWLVGLTRNACQEEAQGDKS